MGQESTIRSRLPNVRTTGLPRASDVRYINRTLNNMRFDGADAHMEDTGGLRVTVPPCRCDQFQIYKRSASSVSVTPGYWYKGGVRLLLDGSTQTVWLTDDGTSTGTASAGSWYVYIYHDWSVFGEPDTVTPSLHVAASKTTGISQVTPPSVVRNMYCGDKRIVGVVTVTADSAGTLDITTIDQWYTGGTLQSNYGNYKRPFDLFDVTETTFKIWEPGAIVYAANSAVAVNNVGGGGMTEVGGTHFTSGTISASCYVWVDIDLGAPNSSLIDRGAALPSPAIDHEIHPLWYINFSTYIQPWGTIDLRTIPSSRDTLQSAEADANTSHSVADFAGTNSALDSLGTKINSLIDKAQAYAWMKT